MNKGDFMRTTLEDLKNRRSCKNYIPKKRIPEEDLDAILECATFAPTGKGFQSPMMVVVNDDETVKTLSKLNNAILGADKDFDPFYGAPTVVVVFADSEFFTYIEDGALVIGNLYNATTALGYGGCWIHRARQMFETDLGLELKKKWGVPDRFKGIGNFVIGYRSGEPIPSKPRKPDYVKKV